MPEVYHVRTSVSQVRKHRGGQFRDFANMAQARWILNMLRKKSDFRHSEVAAATSE